MCDEKGALVTRADEQTLLVLGLMTERPRRRRRGRDAAAEAAKNSAMAEAPAELAQVGKDSRLLGEEAAIPTDFATWDADLRQASALAWGPVSTGPI